MTAPRSHRYVFSVRYDERERCYIAGPRQPTFLAFGRGTTPAEALDTAYEKLEGRLQAIEARGDAVPPPFASFAPGRRVRATLTFTVRDVLRSLAFYEAFGFKVFRWYDLASRGLPPQPGFLHTLDHDLTLALVPGEPTPERASRLSFYALLDELLPVLEDLGGEVVRRDPGIGPEPGPGEMRLPRALVRDPDGYEMEIVEPVLY